MDELTRLEEIKLDQTLKPQSLETILNCDEYFLSLLNDINNAKINIDLETYIYNDDLFGRALADALIKATERGVNVRVLVDGSGTSTRILSLERMESAGVHVKIFHPYPWKPWHLRHANLETSFIFKIAYLLSQLNSRNHRKTCIIDNSIVYVGSVNISQRHLSKKFKGENWQDTVVRLKGYDIEDLELAFNIAWKGFPIEERVKELLLKKRVNSIFRLNYSWRRRRAAYKAMLRKISRSQQRIWITSAYFNPDYMLLKRLAYAAKKGIDVKLILPFKSDVMVMTIVAATFYRQLLKAGVQIYEYLPSILHSKIVIIDDWFCVGSSNLNQRSLRHDLEVDVIIQTEESKHVIEKQFAMNLNKSRVMALSEIQKLPLFKRIFARLLLFIRYFM